MSLQVSQRTLSAAEKIEKSPIMVLCIEGLDTKYGTSTIYELIRIGDPGLLIDGTWRIGGQRAIEDQLGILSLGESTSSIRQTLDVDKGRGSTISSMEIGLVDFDLAATQLITPSLLVEDMLGRKCLVYLGFEGVPFSEFNLIFRGRCDDIKSQPGLVKLNLAHSDNKKRQLIAPKTETKITGAVNGIQTNGFVLESVVDLILPSGDSSFTTYMRVDDEIIRYTGLSGNTLTGVVRGQLGTIPGNHDADADIVSFYVLEGPVMILALKIMLSGEALYYVEDVAITNFVGLPDLSSVPNAIYFNGVNIQDVHGLTIGDFVTSTGATSPANNFTLRAITGIVITDDGSYFTVDGAALDLEMTSSAVLKFSSQYNTLPAKLGLGMTPDEVDVLEHEKLHTLYLSAHNYRFYFKDTIENAQDFIEQEIYKPYAAYSIPRRARSSVGYLTQPIPSSDTLTIKAEDVVKPQNLTIRRTTAKAFFNHIVYSWEQDSLEDKFLRGLITRSQTSVDRIPVGAKAMVIKSLGMRDDLQGATLSESSSDRRINRYEFGAEFFENVQLTFGKGFRIEIGDVVVFDPTGLKISDTTTGTRNKETKLYSVENKTMNLKTGEVTIHLVDTSYANAGRYGLFGPSSRIKVGLANNKFVIEPLNAFENHFGINEFQRWTRYTRAGVKIRSVDWTDVFETNILTIQGNTITVVDDMGFTPGDGYIMELADYDYEGVTSQIKLLYLHWQDAVTFPSDGKKQYNYL